MKAYSFFPGCSLESTARDFLMSSLALARALELDLREIPEWTCCGSTPAHSADSILAAALPARNLAIAERMGMDVIVCCAACYARLASANLALSTDVGLRERVAQATGTLCTGQIRIRHFLQVLNEDVGIEEIKYRVERELRGLKVACYYGCLLARPCEISIFDDSEDPQLMDNLLLAAGAQPIDWPYKTECCGASLSITRTGTARRLSGEILRMARMSGADCIAVACPLCQSNLDLLQMDIEKATGESFELPVFYFTQLMGLAMGLPYESLGIDRLMVDPSRVIGVAKEK